jgi:hypothetical protein
VGSREEAAGNLVEVAVHRKVFVGSSVLVIFHGKYACCFSAFCATILKES